MQAGLHRSCSRSIHEVRSVAWHGAQGFTHQAHGMQLGESKLALPSQPWDAKGANTARESQGQASRKTSPRGWLRKTSRCLQD